MCLPHKRTVRLLVGYLLFVVAFEMLPKADIPETLFDEANTPTNEMVVQEAVSSREHIDLDREFWPRVLADSLRVSVRRISRTYVGQLTDRHRLQELLCTFLC
jgi:hypothetical protein